MARRIDDIDMRAFVFDSRVFGQNGNAAFFFKIVAVHHALVDFLVFPEGAGLTQQLVNQGCFTVVNVGNDGDVTKGAGHGCNLAEFKGRAF